MENLEKTRRSALSSWRVVGRLTESTEETDEDTRCRPRISTAIEPLHK